MLGGFFFWFLLLALAIAVGFLASNYNRSGFLWFLLACVISPVIAGIFLLIMGENNEAEILDDLDKVKKAQQDFIQLYCVNEKAVKKNPILENAFKELSDTEVSSTSKITVEDIDKNINMLLMEVARAEAPKAEYVETHNEKASDHFAQLETLKKLLDINAITSEDFEAKKTEILNRL
ncbi:SHOCT domain-containing protein [Salinivibrio kushneri]|uniref:SHOCT domain-containing protein n=1 Tax=Salinivibrio kushneri TaxID=1908198 RepID=UPI000C82F161|nr:SHOCT domain-containing protein [Salinivibrio kushneri]